MTQLHVQEPNYNPFLQQDGVEEAREVYELSESVIVSSLGYKSRG